MRQYQFDRFGIDIFHRLKSHFKLKSVTSRLNTQGFVNAQSFAQNLQQKYSLQKTSTFQLSQQAQLIPDSVQSHDEVVPFNDARPKLIQHRKVLVVPLSWVATSSDKPFVNLGDALSPIIVSALSGLPVVHQHFDAPSQRLACVGTIAHGFKNGVVHFWGTGIDRQKNPLDNRLSGYRRPPATRFHIHALRGPLSAQVFRAQGIDAPAVYGDPVWFLPSFIKPAQEKQYELGVIVHLSELAELTAGAGVAESILRYKIPASLAADIRIITTLTKPTFADLEARVQEITACKRIVSTSLHGLVIAEAYNIPCVYFRFRHQGAAFADLNHENERVDWRIRDFYQGMGVEKLFVYGQRRTKPTSWDDVMRAIDQHWQPLPNPSQAFLDAFPLPLTFDPRQGKEFTNRSLLHQIKL